MQRSRHGRSGFHTSALPVEIDNEQAWIENYVGICAQLARETIEIFILREGEDEVIGGAVWYPDLFSNVIVLCSTA